MVAVRSFAGISFNHEHITERYGLFTIIVLGESIVVAASGISDLGGKGPVLAAATAGFALAACIWWTYFEYVGSAALSRETLLSSFVWGYGHMLVFSGIAAAALGVELVVEVAAGGESFAGDQRWVLALGLAARSLLRSPSSTSSPCGPSMRWPSFVWVRRSASSHWPPWCSTHSLR